MGWLKCVTSPSAAGLRRVHFWLTMVWFVAAFPIVWLLSESVPFLVFVSVYAVVTGHWSSWQAARAEQAADSNETGP